MFPYRIYSFLRTELSVQNSLQSKVFHLRAVMKTQRFANIWKAALDSRPYAPVWCKCFTFKMVFVFSLSFTYLFKLFNDTRREKLQKQSNMQELVGSWLLLISVYPTN